MAPPKPQLPRLHRQRLLPGRQGPGSQEPGPCSRGHDRAQADPFGIGTKPKHRGTLRALGLGRIGRTHVLPDRPEIRGMVRGVAHLVEVRTQSEGAAK